MVSGGLGNTTEIGFLFLKKEVYCTFIYSSSVSVVFARKEEVNFWCMQYLTEHVLKEAIVLAAMF